MPVHWFFVDRAGIEEPVCDVVAASQPRFSPDGRYVAIQGGWVLDLTDCTVQQLSDGGRAPSWSPNGRRTTFGRGGDIYIKNADGTEDQPALITGQNNQITSLWSPDGDVVYYTETRPNPGGRSANNIVTSSAIAS